jgi:hypothetical protein
VRSLAPFVRSIVRSFCRYDALLASAMPLDSVIVADIDRSTVQLVGDTERDERHGVEGKVPTIGDSSQVFGIGNMSSKHG